MFEVLTNPAKLWDLCLELCDCSEIFQASLHHYSCVACEIQKRYTMIETSNPVASRLHKILICVIGYWNGPLVSWELIVLMWQCHSWQHSDEIPGEASPHYLLSVPRISLFGLGDRKTVLPLKEYSMCVLEDIESTLVQVMAWCHQAPSHYLIQCWLLTQIYYVCISYLISSHRISSKIIRHPHPHPHLISSHNDDLGPMAFQSM